MRTRYAECESCGSEFPVPHMRRLVWARVCLPCERKLNGLLEPGVRRVSVAPRADAPSEFEAEEPGSDWPAYLWRLLLPFLLYLTIGLVCRFGGHTMASLAAGALCADLLTWSIFSLIRAPFEGVRFLVDLMVRVAALILIQGPGIPWLSTASNLDLGAVSFFVVIALRVIWFACWWNDMVGDPDEAVFERLLPHVRE
ncbi:MAG: TraR/DksA C4-type zinc finger protein [Planctomycetota bacterium]